MLNATTLVDAIMAIFEKREGVTASDIQNERRRLYAMRLDVLGQEYRNATKSDKEPLGKDPYELRAA